MRAGGAFLCTQSSGGDWLNKSTDIRSTKMPSLPNPTIWDVNGNGFHASLRIDTADDTSASGTIQDNNGTLPLRNPNNPGDPNGRAVWEEDARRLRFTRVLPNGEGQTFTGILFDTSGVPDHLYALAGIFLSDRFEGRPDFGWYALGDDIITP
jgi:hypothetical protein